CGEKITFIPVPGFIPKNDDATRSRYMPVNLDDKKPHFARCKLNRELAELKRQSSAASKDRSKSSQDAAPKGKRSLTAGQKAEPQQGEMFDAANTATPRN